MNRREALRRLGAIGSSAVVAVLYAAALTKDAGAPPAYADGLPDSLDVESAIQLGVIRRLEVRLDGRKVEHCVAADRKVGRVLVIDPERSRREGYRYHRQLFGHVTFHLKPRPT